MGRREEIESIIRDVEACFSDLSDWETDFIESIRTQWDAKHDLTERQEEKLRDIWEKRT